MRAYVDKYQLDYTVGFDATSAIFHAYHAFVLPTQFFVDKDGVIRYVQLGGITRDQADRIISSLLAGETIAPATPPARAVGRQATRYQRR